MNKFLLQSINMACDIHGFFISWVKFSNIYFSCQTAVKKLMSTCPGQNLVQSIFSCLLALTNPDVYMYWAKFSPSLVDTTSES